MTIPVISSLPEIPAYSDANFETKAPAVLSALRNTFIAEMNAAIAAINSYDYGAAVNASIITGQVAVANGGTGLSSLAAGRIPYGAGTGNFGNSENFVYTSGKLGIGTTAPTKKLEVTDATAAQARLTHSAGSYTDFQTDGNGNLTIAPSGGILNLPYVNVSKSIGNDIEATSATAVDVYDFGSVWNRPQIWLFSAMARSGNAQYRNSSILFTGDRSSSGGHVIITIGNALLGLSFDGNMLQITNSAATTTIRWTALRLL